MDRIAKPESQKRRAVVLEGIAKKIGCSPESVQKGEWKATLRSLAGRSPFCLAVAYASLRAAGVAHGEIESMGIQQNIMKPRENFFEFRCGMPLRDALFALCGQYVAEKTREGKTGGFDMPGFLEFWKGREYKGMLDLSEIDSRECAKAALMARATRGGELDEISLGALRGGDAILGAILWLGSQCPDEDLMWNLMPGAVKKALEDVFINCGNYRSRQLPLDKVEGMLRAQKGKPSVIPHALECYGALLGLENAGWKKGAPHALKKEGRGQKGARGKTEKITAGKAKKMIYDGECTLLGKMLAKEKTPLEEAEALVDAALDSLVSKNKMGSQAAQLAKDEVIDSYARNNNAADPETGEAGISGFQVFFDIGGIGPVKPRLDSYYLRMY